MKQIFRPRMALMSTMLFLFLCLFSAQSHAQGYIAASTYLGGSLGESNGRPVVVNGETYILGSSQSSNFPVTIGSTSGNALYNLTITKLGASGNIIWSRYLGGNGIIDQGNDMKVVNGMVYIVGQTASTNFPVTNGSTFTGPYTFNGFFTKLNAATGAIQFSTYAGTNAMYSVEVSGGAAYIAGTTGPGSNTDILLQKYDASSNALIFSRMIGGTGNDSYRAIYGYGDSNFKVSGNNIYMTATTSSSDFPVTDGTAITSGNGALDYMVLDAATGAVSAATNYYIYPISQTPGTVSLKLDGGKAYITGTATGNTLVSTDGSSYGGTGDTFIIVFDAASGTRQFAKYIGGSGEEYLASMEVQSGIIYLAGTTSSSNFPVTTGSGASVGGGDIFLTKLNATTGALLYSALIGGTDYESAMSMKVSGGDAYIVGYSASADYPVTNGSVFAGGSYDITLTKVSSNNTICYSTFLGSNNNDTGLGLALEGTDVYVTGNVVGNDFPVTNGSSLSGPNDLSFTRFNLSPVLTPGPDNALPATQTICRNGATAQITDTAIIFPSNNMPLIYKAGVASAQNAVELKYQWQKADASSGPWTDIPGAQQLSYAPPTGVVSQYYRRVAKGSLCAGASVISTSTVAAVLVNANTAPTVNAGGVFNTCAGTPVALGGSPTATGVGGATISSYLWTPAGTYTPGNTASNPVVSPTATTIYTVTATDNNGCQQIGQALVNAYAANAGPDVSTCGGQNVRIGAAPIAGLTGVTYSWTASPADATMSCTTCAQPDVHPTVATTYTLTLTIPVTGGGTCSTTDAVVVSPVAAPTAGFAGADKASCLSGTVVLGTPAEAGFTYTWAPGNYLTANNIAQPTYQPGALTMPDPNPITYYVTALKGGCTFTDAVTVSSIEARAGTDGCGPRTIGMPDRTPGVNETYTWTRVSGTGTITGATNTAQTTVSSTTSGTTVYQLDVTYNGVTCSDQVSVGACGCVVPTVAINAAHTCASYSLNNGIVSLSVSPVTANVTYSWSPAAGLSAYTGPTVSLTDNVARTYTVTATSPDGTTCSNTVSVNNPAWSLPVFTAQDRATCPGTTVSLGQPAVAAYSYLWSGTGLSSNTASNPSTAVNSTTGFPVLVTDIGSGCTITDTATVTIPGFPANIAGDDITICGPSSAVQLGVTVSPDLTYIWTPAGTYTPNNTVANPTVPVSTTTTFHVVATNAATGCTVGDDITVTVNPAVSPFSFTDQTYCPSMAGAIALPAGPSGMSSYAWSPASQVINPTSNGPTATTKNPRPASATTYTLTVANASGCTGSASVTYTPSVSVPVAGSSRSICLGSTAQLGATPALAGTYAWTGAAVANLSSTTISNPVFTPIATGSFTFTVSKTDPGGCVTSANVTITVVDFTPGAIASPTVCQNSCVQIGASPVTGAQYFWSPATGLSDAAIANPIACVGTASAAYTLTAIGANGCTSKQNVIVGVNPVPSPSVTVPPVTACLGTTGISFNSSVSPAGTYNYLWTPSDGTLSSIYASNPAVNLTTVGTKSYTVTVTNAATGCASKATTTATVNYCAVPVKLETFTAAPQGSNVILNWTVSEETNVLKYDVEYSATGSGFFKIGTQSAANAHHYSMLHTSPVQGFNYYRLKVTDKDGAAYYSDVKKVNMKVAGTVSVYPNPASSMLNVSVSASMTNRAATLTLIAADGRVVMQKNIKAMSQTESINVSNLANGQYYLRIATDTDVINKPIVVLR